MSEFPAPLPPQGLSKPYGTGRRTRTISALILREMSSQYGRSPGGYVWAVLEPLGMIVILALGFSLLLRSPPLGNSFILFYATGFLPYNVFIKISQVTASSLMYSRPLLTYPAVSWLDAVAARLFLNMLTNALVGYVLLAGIIAATGTQVILSYGPMIAAYVLAAMLGVGMGMVNCIVIGFFPVWQTLWGIITRPLFIASGVILIYEDLPQFAQQILWWNPLMHITGMMREGFFSVYQPEYVSYNFVLIVSLVLVTFGLMLMRRYHRDVLNL